MSAHRKKPEYDHELDDKRYNAELWPAAFYVHLPCFFVEEVNFIAHRLLHLAGPPPIEPGGAGREAQGVFRNRSYEIPHGSRSERDIDRSGCRIRESKS